MPNLLTCSDALQHLIGPDGEVLVQYEASASKDQVAQSVADEMMDYSRRNPVWSGYVTFTYSVDLRSSSSHRMYAVLFQGVSWELHVYIHV